LRIYFEILAICTYDWLGLYLSFGITSPSGFAKKISQTSPRELFSQQAPDGLKGFEIGHVIYNKHPC